MQSNEARKLTDEELKVLKDKKIDEMKDMGVIKKSNSVKYTITDDIMEKRK